MSPSPCQGALEWTLSTNGRYTIRSLAVSPAVQGRLSQWGRRMRITVAWVSHIHSLAEMMASRSAEVFWRRLFNQKQLVVCASTSRRAQKGWPPVENCTAKELTNTHVAHRHPSSGGGTSLQSHFILVHGEGPPFSHTFILVRGRDFLSVFIYICIYIYTYIYEKNKCSILDLSINRIVGLMFRIFLRRVGLCDKRVTNEWGKRVWCVPWVYHPLSVF